MPALLAILGWGGGIAKTIGEWLSRRSLAEIACLALALYAAFATLEWKAEKRHALKSDAQVVKCAQARTADQTAYRRAQADAAKENALQLALVKSEQEAINEQSSQSYEADLARLRAELGRLRPQSKPVAGTPGSPAPPDLPNPAARPDASGTVCISTDAYVSAAQTELQLDHLEQWVSEQTSLNPNRNP